MADIKRLIRLTAFFAFGLLLGGAATYASAETIAATSGGVKVNNGSAGGAMLCATQLDAFADSFIGKSYPSADALKSAVQSAATIPPVCSSYTFTLSSVVLSGGYKVIVTWASTVSGTVYNSTSNIEYLSGVYFCPSGQNWTLSGSTCTRPDCVAPEQRQPDGTCGSSCYAGNPSEAGFYNGRFTTGNAETTVGNRLFPGATLCDGQCLGTVGALLTCNAKGYTVAMKAAGINPPAGIPVKCTYAITLTGASCTATPEDATPAYDPCYAKGKVTGYVNGVAVCGGNAPTQTTTKSTEKGQTANTPVGSGTPSTTDNPETTKEETTECDDSGCKTVTKEVTKNPDGTTSEKTQEKSQDTTSFCQENPTSPFCKSASYTDNGCKVAPVCDGDAVQCAQAREAWKARCNAETEPTDPSYLLGKTIAEGGADSITSPLDPSNHSGIDVGGIVSTAASQRTLSRSCIRNPSFSALGHSYTMDATLFCQFAGIVGYLMIAASSIIAVRMVAS